MILIGVLHAGACDSSSDTERDAEHRSVDIGQAKNTKLEVSLADASTASISIDPNAGTLTIHVPSSNHSVEYNAAYMETVCDGSECSAELPTDWTQAAPAGYPRDIQVTVTSLACKADCVTPIRFCIRDEAELISREACLAELASTPHGKLLDTQIYPSWAASSENPVLGRVSEAKVVSDFVDEGGSETGDPMDGGQ